MSKDCKDMSELPVGPVGNWYSKCVPTSIPVKLIQESIFDPGGMYIQCAVCFEVRPDKAIVRTRKARPFTYERLSSHVKESIIHEEALKRKTGPTSEKKKKQKKLGFFFRSKASSEAGSNVVSHEEVIVLESVQKNQEPMERRKMCRSFMVQKQLDLKLRRKALPNNLGCGLLDYDELINSKKQEGLLVYSKYFSSAMNDEYTSRSIGDSTIFSIFPSSCMGASV